MSASPPADAGQTSEIGEVVVTARKFRESAIAVPVSITSMSAAQVQSRNIVSLDTLSTFVPGFTFANGATGTFRTMRGGGSTGSSFSFDQSTGLFIDDVSYGRNEQGRLPIFDLDNIDVLRGPQPITFGNSTTAGAVTLTTRKPGDVYEADASALYEFENRETNLRAGVTIPVNDKVSIRVSGYYDSLQKGWIDNIFGGQSSYGPNNRDAAGRIILLAKPTDRLTVTLKYEYDQTESTGTDLVPYGNALNNPLTPVVGLGTTVNKGQGSPFNVPADYLHMSQNNYFGQIKYDLGFAQITSTTNYWDFQWNQGANSAQTAVPLSFFNTLDHYNELSNETRLSGNILENLSYLVGTYFNHGQQDAKTILSLNQAGLGVPNPAPPFARLTDLAMKVTTFSGFADFTWKITDKLQLEPGIRVAKVWRTGDQLLTGADVISGAPNPTFNPYVPTVAGGVVHNFAGLSAPETHVEPQVVLSYRADANLNFFARAARAVKAGGIDWSATSANPSQAIFRPETATDFEAGFKSRWLDRRLEFNLTAFHTDYANLQVSVLAAGRFITTNAGASVSQGFEAETSAKPFHALTVSGSLAYLDAHYTSFANGTCTVQQSLTLPSPCSRDLSGQTTPFASKWSATGRAEYAFELPHGVLTPSVEVNFRSAYNASSADDPLAQQPGLTLVNSRLEYVPEGAKWRIALYGKNLTNQLYTNFVAAGSSALIRGGSSATVERLRQVGLQVSAQF
ncbi:MAG: TonB-dependent receptor [Caulobacteraceae bacterium]|nr:TonB-dependent receptor [Caulobacteraceae bacterium]